MQLVLTFSVNNNLKSYISNKNKDDNDHEIIKPLCTYQQIPLDTANKGSLDRGKMKLLSTRNSAETVPAKSVTLFLSACTSSVNTRTAFSHCIYPQGSPQRSSLLSASMN